MIRTLPEEVLRSRPNLCNMYAITVLMPPGQWDAAEAWLQDAERMLLAAGDVSAKTQTARPTGPIEAKDEKIALVVGARALIAMDREDLRGSISLNPRTLKLFPDGRQTPVLSTFT